ncbi:DEDD exonuclease domain-containing protein [soil metagenome]
MDNGILGTTFLVCDVETNGMSYEHSRITEIAFIKIRNGEIAERFSTLINPGQHIPYEITRLTGISNDLVKDKPYFEDIASQLIDFIRCDEEIQGKDLSNIVFTGHNVAFDFNFVQSAFRRYDPLFHFNLKRVCTCKLARRLLRKLKSKSLSSVAEHLECSGKNFHRAYDDTLATAKIFLKFIDMLSEHHEIDTLDELLKFQNRKVYTDSNKSPVLKRINKSLKDFPRSPGVYFMKSKNDEILYIGKAKSLRERLSNYLNFNSDLPPRIQQLIPKIHDIEFEVTASELSALILESKLIKKFKPRFNTAIKRHRFHPFLKLDVQNEYPRMDKVYEIENDGAHYFGPFSSGRTVNSAIKDIHDNFYLRKCEIKKLKASIDHSTCMYLEMGKCKAPCNFTQTNTEYKKEVETVQNYLTSDERGSVQEKLTMQMELFAERNEFERAASVRDRLKDIRRVMSFQKVITSAINNKKIIIKQDLNGKREIFFIQNGKLMNTYTLTTMDDYNQVDFVNEITDTTDYLFFSLSKFVQHKFSNEELDEIKVISNWLAVNRDKNSVLEVNESHSRQDIVNFVIS